MENLDRLSRLCDRFRDRPSVKRGYLYAIDVPLIGDALMAHSARRELRILGAHSPGFRAPFRDLRRDDVAVRSKTRMRSVLAQSLTEHRNRMHLKITGWPRLPFSSNRSSKTTSATKFVLSVAGVTRVADRFDVSAGTAR